MRYDLIVWVGMVGDDYAALTLVEHEAGAVPRQVEVFSTGRVLMVRPEPGYVSVRDHDYPPEEAEALEFPEAAEIHTFPIDRASFEAYAAAATRTEFR